jgi:hypothetical protein
MERNSNVNQEQQQQRIIIVDKVHSLCNNVIPRFPCLFSQLSLSCLSIPALTLPMLFSTFLTQCSARVYARRVILSLTQQSKRDYSFAADFSIRVCQAICYSKSSVLFMYCVVEPFVLRVAETEV